MKIGSGQLPAEEPAVKGRSKIRSTQWRSNRQLARKTWSLDDSQLGQLKLLSEVHGLSVRAGDIQLLDGKWYITHSGLLGIAARNQCSGIHTEVVANFSDAEGSRWVVRATVFKTPRSKGFVGYGDADPSNVSLTMRGAEMRIAETRAVNRALRKAYGIGQCSVEELGAGGTTRGAKLFHGADNHNGNGQPRLRDRLLLFIRQYQLDAEQVKLYAAHFCGTASLRETSREQIQSFLDHLAILAAEGRDKLVEEIASVSRTMKSNGTADQTAQKEAA